MHTRQLVCLSSAVDAAKWEGYLSLNIDKGNGLCVLCNFCRFPSTSICAGGLGQCLGSHRIWHLINIKLFWLYLLVSMCFVRYCSVAFCVRMVSFRWQGCSQEGGGGLQVCTQQGSREACGYNIFKPHLCKGKNVCKAVSLWKSMDTMLDNSFCVLVWSLNLLIVYSLLTINWNSSPMLNFDACSPTAVENEVRLSKIG